MIIDDKLVFSDHQHVTVTAQSTDVINTGEVNANLGAGTPLLVRFVIETTFANATSMVIALCHGATDNTVTVLIQTAVIAEAALLKGAFIPPLRIPDEHLMHLALTYTVDGAHNAGAITAFISLDR